MDWPTVQIIIVTFDRPVEIRKTIYALLKNIKYKGKLLWHIADDNTPGPYIENLKKEFHYLDLSATITNRKGWGANVNKALKYTKENYIFLIEDDYTAQQSVDLSQGVAILEKERDVGIVRYDGLTGHINLNLWVKESKTNLLGTVPFLQIDLKKSGHLNVYSNRPHLRHRRLHDKLGLYPETLPMGKTEEGYAMRVKKNEHLRVICLNTGIVRGFEHIGQSRQGTKMDVNFKK